MEHNHNCIIYINHAYMELSLANTTIAGLFFTPGNSCNFHKDIVKLANSFRAKMLFIAQMHIPFLVQSD